MEQIKFTKYDIEHIELYVDKCLSCMARGRFFFFFFFFFFCFVWGGGGGGRRGRWIVDVYPYLYHVVCCKCINFMHSLWFAVLGIAIALIVTTTFLLALYILKKRKGKQTIPKLHAQCMYTRCLYTYNIIIPDNQANFAQDVIVDMKQCVAYEITSLAKRKVAMERNPAYEQVTMNVK